MTPSNQPAAWSTAQLQRRLVQLPAETRPILSVVIHTEEEFDWNREFDPEAVSVRHAAYLHRTQDLFDRYQVRPTYVVDYPIADQEAAYLPIKAFADQGRAEIGAHLHPWVSPPVEERVSPYNSYPGNLPEALEREKLRLLSERIHASFGVRPRSYLAGRYGFGPHTAAILEDLGYLVDISPAPPIDFRFDSGPDYSGFGNEPYWFGDNDRLLGLPGTGAYVGALRPVGHPLYRLATHPRLSKAHLPGILSRLRLLERIRLSPEGYLLSELQRLTRSLLRRGIRVFVFSFHSPSVLPGCTPYVRNNHDLKQFLAAVEGYLRFFREEIGGIGMTALEVREFVHGQASQAGP